MIDKNIVTSNYFIGSMHGEFQHKSREEEARLLHAAYILLDPHLNIRPPGEYDTFLVGDPAIIEHINLSSFFIMSESGFFHINICYPLIKPNNFFYQKN